MKKQEELLELLQLHELLEQEELLELLQLELLLELVNEVEAVIEVLSYVDLRVRSFVIRLSIRVEVTSLVI